ncbi:MAG TPA: histidine kinase [Actinophytocola sp.]|nr:histidine kinase [Actinophytocola sp.]
MPASRRSLLPARRDLALAALTAGVVLVVTRIHADALDRPLNGFGYLLLAVAALALAWRRLHPMTVLAVTLVLVLPGYALGPVRGPAMIVVAIAVYTVATRTRWPTATGLGVVLVGVWAGAEAVGGRLGRDAMSVDQLLWVALFVAVGVAVGATRRARAARTAHDVEQRRLGVERERLRMAREVHDVVSHSLAVINLQAGVAAHVAARRPEQAVAALREIRETSRAALTDLRATLAVLREPDGSELPEPPGTIEPAGLHRLAEVVRAGEAAGLQVTLRGEAGPLPEPVDVAAFRIVQEAVTNVIRHARDARHLTIDLCHRRGLLRLRVADDGRTPAAPDPRHGLRGMAERATALGGSAAAGPGGPGFLVEAEIPVRPTR